MNINDYIAEWDPVGLIKDGYPVDEYNSEAFEVSFRYKKTMSELEIANMVHDIFVERLGLDPKGFEEQCKTRAGEIKKLLDQSRH